MEQPQLLKSFQSIPISLTIFRFGAAERACEALSLPGFDHTDSAPGVWHHQEEGGVMRGLFLFLEVCTMTEFDLRPNEKYR
jgi:hypothetical protein